MTGDQKENIEKAISHLEMAYTREVDPNKWAITHNNLGNAYCGRLTSDKKNNIDPYLPQQEQNDDLFENFYQEFNLHKPTDK